ASWQENAAAAARFRNADRSALAAQHFEAQRHRLAEPERIDRMIAIAVAGLGMDENAQALAVKHQPRHDFRELARREGNLIHGNRMRPNRHVVPAAELRVELLTDRLTQ